MQELVNTATATYKVGGATLNAEPSEATFLVVKNLINLLKSFSPESGQSGDTTQVTIKVTCLATSPISAQNVIVTDVLPAGLTFVTGSVTINGTPNPAANPATGILIGTMTPGQVVDVKFNVSVD